MIEFKINQMIKHEDILRIASKLLIKHSYYSEVELIDCDDFDFIAYDDFCRLYNKYIKYLYEDEDIDSYGIMSSLDYIDFSRFIGYYIKENIINSK